MELRAYWLAIKAGWKIVLGALLVAVVAASLLTWRATPQYVSSTQLFVAAQTGSEDLDELYLRNAIAQQRVGGYVVLAMSESVAEAASDEVGFKVDSDNVVAVVVLGTMVFEISVTDSDPQRARAIAAAYASVLPPIVQDLEQVGGATSNTKLTIIEEATEPTAPPVPIVRNLIAALVLGFGVGVGIAVLRYAMRETRARAGSDNRAE